MSFTPVCPWRAAIFVLAWTVTATAKPPTLDSLFPPGGQRGETVTVTAAGSFGQWPVKTWTEDAGLSVTVLPEKGKLSIAVAADARVGVHWLRLHDDEGATSQRPFLVGTLPELVETEPNDDPLKPQRLEAAALTINGKLARNGDVDCYAVPLQKGQTLAAAIAANGKLGAPMDGLLQLATATGFVLAENDDAPDRDPMLVFNAEADGTYIVRVFAFPAEPDSRIGFSGGESYIYRLTLTTAGYLDHVYPLAVSRAAPGPVEAVGWNIPESARKLTVALGAIDDLPDRIAVDHPLLPNAGEVRIVPHCALIETEPNDLEHPQEVTFPATITGRIDPPRDQDVYAFAGRKDEKWLIRVESRTLGHPLDAVLKVIGANGKVLSEMDDPGSGGGRRRSSNSTMRDPELTFTVPADGSYRVVVRDLHHQGSFRHVYRLSVMAPVAGFALGVAADQFALAPGPAALKIPVTITRDDGFSGSIEVEAVGLPDDVKAPRATSSASGSTARTVTLELTTSREPWSGPFRIVGRSVEKEAAAPPRAATTPRPGLNAPTEDLWLTVVKPAAGAKAKGSETKKEPGP